VADSNLQNSYYAGMAAQYRRTMQSVIGRQLRDEYEVSEEMPHKLLAILLQLTEREADE
jgi:hypothetical protein